MNINTLVVIDWILHLPNQIHGWNRPQNVIIFGDSVFKRGSYIEMKSWGRVLIQYDSFPFKKKSRQRHIQREDIKTQGGRQPSAHQEKPTLTTNTVRCSAHLTLSFWGQETSEGTSLADNLFSDFKPPEQWQSSFQLFKPPKLWYFVMAVLGNSHIHSNIILVLQDVTFQGNWVKGT